MHCQHQVNLQWNMLSDIKRETASLYWRHWLHQTIKNEITNIWDNYTIKNWLKKNIIKQKHCIVWSKEYYRKIKIEDTGQTMQNKRFFLTKQLQLGRRGRSDNDMCKSLIQTENKLHNLKGKQFMQNFANEEQAKWHVYWSKNNTSVNLLIKLISFIGKLHF